MKHLKRFNENNGIEELDFYIDIEPYDESQFGQSKHKVYCLRGKDLYYLGDFRYFKDGEKPLSYLNLDNIKSVDDVSSIRPLNDVELKELNKELDRDSLNRDLMAKTVSYRDKLKSGKLNESNSIISNFFK